MSEPTPPSPWPQPLPPPPPAPRRPGRFAKLLPVLLALAGVLFTTAVISSQVESRDDFANSELAQGVEERWGAPVEQPAPSVRYVESGTIFTELKQLPLERQHVLVDAQMNYRKRGLRSFSGFDFAFTGDYAVANRRGRDIDVAFVFPVEMNKAQVLLSELEFLVNGDRAPLELGEERNRLVWTGRIPDGKTFAFRIHYRARGLDRFTYLLDPSLAAKDVQLHLGVTGGENFDYPEGVLSASQVRQAGGALALDWAFASLEAGVNLGVVLPSQQAWDATISTMATRAWAPFLALCALLFGLGARHKRPLASYEWLLLSALFGFTFVLVAYLAAFLPFAVAWPLSVVGLGAAATLYLRHVFPRERWKVLAGLWVATMAVPTLAVVAQGYTGLIYTVELLAALLGALALSTRPAVRAFLDDALTRSRKATS